METLQVEVTTLDTYVEEQDLRQVDVIKIDVESMEHIVLEGASKTLELHSASGLLRGVIHRLIANPLIHIASKAGYVSLYLGNGVLELRDGISPNPLNPNQLLWPGEQMERLKDFAKQIGYRLDMGNQE